MKRRELVAGVASVGVLGGGAAVLWRGLPFGSERDAAQGSTSDGNGDETSGPTEVEVLEAPDGAPSTLAIPNDGTTLAMFFSPVCSQCRSLMPNLAEARDRLDADHGDDLTVVSVTAQQSPDQLRDWWDDHDGVWVLAHDPDRALTTAYDVVTHPVLLAIDDAGAVQWEYEGLLEADRIVREVEDVLDSGGSDGTEETGETDGTEESDETDESEESDETDETDESEESDA